MLKSAAKRLPPLKRLVEERDSLREERDTLRRALAAGGQHDNLYDDAATITAAVASGDHRGVIGGNWEQIGMLQFDYLKNHGLEPNHRLLDIGCGSLRGGVHFINYLEPGNYWGIDINQSLLDAGWEHELGPAGLQSRQPQDQLVQLDDFQFDRLGTSFDMAIAQSLFSHMNFNNIRRCLRSLEPLLASGGKFFATIFTVPADHDLEEPCPQLDTVVSHSVRDPFHYRVADMAHAAEGLDLTATFLGDWDHPRNQKMVVFENC